MKKCTLLRIVSTFIAFSLLPLSALIGVHALDPLPHITPHYLLNGKEADTKGNFVFYKIDNKDEYAIGLTDEAKALTDVGDLPKTYKDENEASHPVTGIWRNGFHKSKVTSISIGSNIKTIDFEAFMYSDLITLTIPNTVEKLGEAAFYACNQLQSVTFGTPQGGADDCSCTIPEDPADPIIDLIPAFCFFKCSELKNLSLPTSVVTIEPEAFNGCSNITSAIYLPNIKFIRARAFQSCTSIQNIYIGSSMFETDGLGPTDPRPQIEPHAFQFCAADLSITFFGDLGKIATWKTNFPHWGWYSNGTPNASNCYISTDVGADSYASDSVWYTQAFEHDSSKIKITGYNGKIPTHFIAIPDKIDGKEVAEIDANAFTDSVKGALERLYLPTTLLNIQTRQFGAKYTKLTVISDNTQCGVDSLLGDDYWKENGKIDLHNLTQLQFIGDVAFTDLGGGVKSGFETKPGTISGTETPRNKIKKVHLPANLIAIGSSAFCSEAVASPKDPATNPNRTGNRYGYVTDFKWDYNEDTSRLECIGGDAFMKFGSRYGETITETSGLSNYTYTKHERTTLIFPRTFKHFGLTEADINYYKSDDFKDIYKNKFIFVWASRTEDQNNILRTYNRPGHAFLGCPLLYKVIFKGSNDSSKIKTEDLVIPVQTFVLNESLQTVIFEERDGKTITFHTQWANFWQQSIGSSGGRAAGKVDFRADPMLQTLILPNVLTNIRLQNFSFFGNARAALYFSGPFDPETTMANGAKVFGNKAKDKQWPDQLKNGFSDDCNLSDSSISKWCKIGDETRCSAGDGGSQGYRGYCFAPNAATTADYTKGDLNSFGIDQDMKYYSSIHYKEVIKDDAGKTITTVEVGAGNSKELILDETSKCAFVCERGATNKTATMSNYLYDLRSASINVATVPETITVPEVNATTSVVNDVKASNAGNYTVNEIGDNAFSACYCDGDDGTNLNTPTGDDYRIDLKRVVIPNTVTEIGNYAFMRAYGLIEVSTSSNANTYYMPSALTKIGKCAFAFCNVKQVRRIPKNCVLYENTSEANGRTPSAFINDFSLRLITFLDGSGETFESDYYVATKYRIKNQEEGKDDVVDNFQTTALYSKDASGGEFVSFKDRLLVVLYRENTYKTVDESDPDVTVSEGNNSFNGKWPNDNNPFLFGAFKMAYWIDELTLGKIPSLDKGTYNINKDGLSPTLNGQPLFSGICNRNTSGVITDKPIYLNNPADAYYTSLGDKGVPVTNHECDLYKIEVSDLLSLPKYAFNGCEKIESVIFPKTGTSIPDGLFANNTKDGVKYYVKDPSEPVDGNVVDLRGSQITKIGAELFKNNTYLTTFIAPNHSNGLTIDVSAFSGCKNLTALDFSHMTGGTLQINANAFEKCGNLNIIWPSAPVTIKLNQNYIFQGSAITAIELPTNVNSDLGTGIFKDCANLSSVTLSGNNPNITKINGSAFENCRSLNTFEFAKFTGLTEVGEGAFRSTDNSKPNGTLGGNIELPATLDKIRKEAFKATKMTSLKISYAGDSLDLGEGCFAYNKSLTTVDFNKDSELSDDTYLRFDNSNKLGVFENCGNSLTKIFLSEEFNLATEKLYDFVLADTNVELFIYKKFNNFSGSLSSNWLKRANGNLAPVYFQLDSNGAQAFIDLNNKNAITINYWATINDEFVKLGTATKSDDIYSFSSATTWKLKSSGWYQPS